MLSGSKRYKIFFPITASENWAGGLNYFKNLFHAISMLKDNELEIFIPPDNPESLSAFSNVLSKYRKKTLAYRFEKKFRKIKREIYFFNRLKKMDIISHSFNCHPSIPTISWIPDFQHVHLPQMFSEDELKIRDETFYNAAKKQAIVLLSSKDALNDFVNLYPEYSYKARVLNFVSYIDPSVYNLSETQKAAIITKFKLPKKYFYIPNQFWKHKNHITVFKAVKILKDKGLDIQVVCSGYKNDYRNNEFFDTLKTYIIENNIEENIHILGLIKQEEVYYLMRNCVSVINPSLFEGWSTTVEEAKSLGKNIILSDLAVHKEQNPAEAIYFKRESAEDLAFAIQKNWNTKEAGPDLELEEIAIKNMQSRMLVFAQNYKEIILEIVKNKIDIRK